MPADKSQSYAIGHTGSVLGSDFVTLEQNQISPQRQSAVITFECPKKFEHVEYVGRRDATRFVPRALETFDGDGTETDFTLTGDVQPVAGEEDVDDQEYPAVVAYDTDASAQIAVSTIDYAANTVTLASAPSNATDNLKLWHILCEGTVQFRAKNQFGQTEGTVYPWSTPVYRWHDYNQLQAGREINLQGRLQWTRNEEMEVTLDSPRQIVWEDSDYPEGEYVSTFEQDVEIGI